MLLHYVNQGWMKKAVKEICSENLQAILDHPIQMKPIPKKAPPPPPLPPEYQSGTLQ